jgi:hypothetical protein
LIEKSLLAELNTINASQCYSHKKVIGSHFFSNRCGFSFPDFGLKEKNSERFDFLLLQRDRLNDKPYFTIRKL